MRGTSNTLGILCVLAGLALFSVQDLILKLLSGSYPLHQAMVFRSLTAAPLMLAIVWRYDGSPRSLLTPGWPRMLARGLLNFIAYGSFYLGLAALPLATTVALYFTAPLMITILSVLVLRETVSLPRWIAVLAGFGGVIILVRPGDALFDWAALLPVVSGFAYGLSMIYARTLGRTETAAAMAFWGNLAFLGFALALSVIFGSGRFDGQSHASLAFMMRGWVWPSGQDLALMCGCGVIAAFGLTLLTQGYRIAKSSTVAPFEYSLLFWGLLWGWLIWGDWPDGTGWLGISVIIGAGLFVLHRETTEAKLNPHGSA